jgi:hypothetical protein
VWSWQPTQPSVVVKNEWSFTPTSSYVFVTCAEELSYTTYRPVLWPTKPNIPRKGMWNLPIVPRLRIHGAIPPFALISCCLKHINWFTFTFLIEYLSWWYDSTQETADVWFCLTYVTWQLMQTTVRLQVGIDLLQLRYRYTQAWCLSCGHRL